MKFWVIKDVKCAQPMLSIIYSWLSPSLQYWLQCISNGVTTIRHIQIHEDSRLDMAPTPKCIALQSDLLEMAYVSTSRMQIPNGVILQPIIYLIHITSFLPSTFLTNYTVMTKKSIIHNISHHKNKEHMQKIIVLFFAFSSGKTFCW